MPPLATATPALSPVDFHLFTGLEVPDIITFVVSPQWCDRPQLYPRQATLLKVIFLRNDLLTDYDHLVIDEWEESFRRTGDNGIVPGIRQRMAALRLQGYEYFREVLLVLGRRAGKGYVSALAMAYVLWRFMAKGDPQKHYGIDRDKQMACFVYAGKKQQAVLNLWKDLIHIIRGGPCFAKYVSRPLGESLSVYAPHDFVRMRKLRDRGISTQLDMATFLIQPKEATLMSGRGPTAFMMGFDEMAHVVASSGSSRSAEEVYCLDPATKVLCADLIWRPISELEPGDKLVGFDEFAEPGKQRKLRESTVKAKWATRGEALRVHFDDGSSVVCSPNHRWFKVELSAKGEINNGKWIQAGYTTRIGSAGHPSHLKVGDHIRHIVDPWEVDDTRDGGWLAGILDGEGWVSSPKTSAFKVGIAQNPGLVLEKTKDLLKQHGFDFYQWNKHASRQTDCEQVEVRGIANVLRLLGQFRPERLLAKSAGSWQDKTPRGYTKFKTITEIEQLPEQDLIDIETTTKTFIAEGLVSHNSAATPALDQFKKDGFIIDPSSPWQMIGQFYANWKMCLEVDDKGEPEHPYMMFLQLASWEIYYDWETAHELPLLPDEFQGDLGEYIHEPKPGFIKLQGAFQEFDERMEKLEKANPETFKVERRSKWQAVTDSYLDPTKIAAMFDHDMPMVTEAKNLTTFYKGHADPSKVNDNFAVAIAHAETGEDGYIRCVFDYIHHWQPSEFPDHIIDYIELEDRLFDLVWGFKTDEFTFDQHNSAMPIQKLNQRVRKLGAPKRMMIFEQTATAPHNWERAEAFKVSLNQGWIKAPYYETAELELKFLQRKDTATMSKVVHQTTGPVIHDDVATTMMECVWKILGDQAASYTAGMLSDFKMGALAPGGFNAYARQEAQGNDVITKLRGSRGTAIRGGALNPARNPYRRGRR
jgi:hypothetical protein